jgi:hypothetical protein
MQILRCGCRESVMTKCSVVTPTIVETCLEVRIVKLDNKVQKTGFKCYNIYEKFTVIISLFEMYLSF